MSEIKFVFFDIGYTLVNEDAVWAERCKQQAATEHAQEMGITADALMEELWEASKNLQPPWKFVMQQHGFEQSAKYNGNLEKPYDDAPLVLEKLGKKFRLGIIANQSGGLDERLRSFGLDRYFSVVISSADFGFSKPDKRLFLAALKKSGCAAHNAVFVGDRLDNDILPAKSLGFVTVRIKQGFAKNQVAPSKDWQPDYEVNSLSELLQLPFALE